MELYDGVYHVVVWDCGHRTGHADKVPDTCPACASLADQKIRDFAPRDA